MELLDFQDGMNQEQAKVKLRGQIATEQEKLLGDRDKELGECRDQLRDSKELLDSLNRKLLDTEKIVTERDEKVQELEKVIKPLDFGIYSQSREAHKVLLKLTGCS